MSVETAKPGASTTVKVDEALSQRRQIDSQGAVVVHPADLPFNCVMESTMSTAAEKGLRYKGQAGGFGPELVMPLVSQPQDGWISVNSAFKTSADKWDPTSTDSVRFAVLMGPRRRAGYAPRRAGYAPGSSNLAHASGTMGIVDYMGTRTLFMSPSYVPFIPGKWLHPSKALAGASPMSDRVELELCLVVHYYVGSGVVSDTGFSDGDDVHYGVPHRIKYSGAYNFFDTATKEALTTSVPAVQTTVNEVYAHVMKESTAAPVFIEYVWRSSAAGFGESSKRIRSFATVDDYKKFQKARNANEDHGVKEVIGGSEVHVLYFPIAKVDMARQWDYRGYPTPAQYLHIPKLVTWSTDEGVLTYAAPATVQAAGEDNVLMKITATKADVVDGNDQPRDKAPYKYLVDVYKPQYKDSGVPAERIETGKELWLDEKADWEYDQAMGVSGDVDAWYFGQKRGNHYEGIKKNAVGETTMLWIAGEVNPAATTPPFKYTVHVHRADFNPDGSDTHTDNTSAHEGSLQLWLREKAYLDTSADNWYLGVRRGDHYEGVRRFQRDNVLIRITDTTPIVSGNVYKYKCRVFFKGEFDTGAGSYKDDQELWLVSLIEGSPQESDLWYVGQRNGDHFEGAKRKSGAVAYDNVLLYITGDTSPASATTPFKYKASVFRSMFDQDPVAQGVDLWLGEKAYWGDSLDDRWYAGQLRGTHYEGVKVFQDGHVMLKITSTEDPPQTQTEPPYAYTADVYLRQYVESGSALPVIQGQPLWLMEKAVLGEGDLHLWYAGRRAGGHFEGVKCHQGDNVLMYVTDTNMTREGAAFQYTVQVFHAEFKDDGTRAPAIVGSQHLWLPREASFVTEDDKWYIGQRRGNHYEGVKRYAAGGGAADNVLIRITDVREPFPSPLNPTLPYSYQADVYAEQFSSLFLVAEKQTLRLPYRANIIEEEDRWYFGQARGTHYEGVKRTQRDLYLIQAGPQKNSSATSAPYIYNCAIYSAVFAPNGAKLSSFTLSNQELWLEEKAVPNRGSEGDWYMGRYCPDQYSPTGGHWEGVRKTEDRGDNLMIYVPVPTVPNPQYVMSNAAFSYPATVYRYHYDKDGRTLDAIQNGNDIGTKRLFLPYEATFETNEDRWFIGYEKDGHYEGVRAGSGGTAPTVLLKIRWERKNKDGSVITSAPFRYAVDVYAAAQGTRTVNGNSDAYPAASPVLTSKWDAATQAYPKGKEGTEVYTLLLPHRLAFTATEPIKANAIPEDELWYFGKLCGDHYEGVKRAQKNLLLKVTEAALPDGDDAPYAYSVDVYGSQYVKTASTPTETWGDSTSVFKTDYKLLLPEKTSFVGASYYDRWYYGTWCDDHWEGVKVFQGDNFLLKLTGTVAAGAGESQPPYRYTADVYDAEYKDNGESNTTAALATGVTVILPDNLDIDALPDDDKWYFGTLRGGHWEGIKRKSASGGGSNLVLMKITGPKGAGDDAAKIVPGLREISGLPAGTTAYVYVYDVTVFPGYYGDGDHPVENTGVAGEKLFLPYKATLASDAIASPDPLWERDRWYIGQKVGAHYEGICREQRDNVLIQIIESKNSTSAPFKYKASIYTHQYSDDATPVTSAALTDQELWLSEKPAVISGEDAWYFGQKRGLHWEGIKKKR